MANSQVNGKTFVAVLLFAIVLLVLGLLSFGLIGWDRPAFERAELLEFADYDYQRRLTKEDVVALLGPPTSSDPIQPGFAECCSWEATYPTIVGSNSYRLTLSFNGSGGTIVAGGLYKNGEVVHR